MYGMNNIKFIKARQTKEIYSIQEHQGKITQDQCSNIVQ
jgi:hypothetical protein